MSRLIITITAGAVSTLVGMAAMAAHEGTQGSNMGTGSIAQQGVNPSQLQQQQAQQQFAIDQQYCATLKFQDHNTYDQNAYDQCIHQATVRRDQQATGGDSFAGSQEQGQPGEKKDTGIVDKFTTAVKDKLADLGMGTDRDRQDKGVSGQQGAQQEHAQGQGGQPQASWQGGQQAWQGQHPQQGFGQGQGGHAWQGGQSGTAQGMQPQQGYAQGQGGPGDQQNQGGQGQSGFQHHATGGQDQLQMHPYDPGIAEGGLTTAERYLLQHGRAQPEVYALNLAYQQYAIQRQECDTLKNAAAQSYEQCLQQAHTARDQFLSSGMSAAREAHKGAQEGGS